MANLDSNTLPLPLELVYEILSHCNARTVWNFSRTSRLARSIAFRKLVADHRFPLDIPQAVHTGALEIYRADGTYDLFESVAIDVTKDTWSKYGQSASYLPELLSFLEHRRDRQKKTPSVSVKIYTCDGDCSVDAVVTVFGQIFRGFYDIIQGLALHLEVAQIDEDVWRETLNKMGDRIIEQIYPDLYNGQVPNEFTAKEVPLTSLDLRIKAANPRRVMNTVINTMASLLNDLVDTILEEIKIVVNQKNQKSYNASDVSYLWLERLRSEATKRVWIEDKNWPETIRRATSIAEVWPNVEELNLDCGFTSAINIGYHILWTDLAFSLCKLQKLSIPFPYTSRVFSDLQKHKNCCMRSAFRWYLSEGLKNWKERVALFKAYRFALREITFHYLQNDGLTTNFTKVKSINIWRARGRDPDLGKTCNWGPRAASTTLDESGAAICDSEKEPVFDLFIMEDLGDRPTDPIDFEVMREMMLEPSLRSPKRHGITVDPRFLKPFMSGLAKNLIENGDTLSIKDWDWDGDEDRDVNRAGTKCSQCDCITEIHARDCFSLP